VLALVLGSLFIWMRATTFSPNGYAAKALTVQGENLLQSKVTSYVQEDLLTQERSEELAQRVVEPLPIGKTEKDFLATGIAAGVRSQVDNAVNAFFDTGAGKEFGAAISTRLTDEIINLINNDTGVFEFEGDAVVLNTQPIVQGARAQLESSLGNLARFLPPPPESYRTITVVQGDYVSTVQSAISIIWLMSWLLPLIFLVLLVAGLIAARERRPAAFRTMIAIIVGLAVVAITIRVARRVITNLVNEGPGQDVVGAILSAATSDLVDQTLVLVLIAAIIGGALWLLGPDKPARYARAWLADRARDLRSGDPRPAGRVTEFARQRRAPLEIGGAVLAAIVLLLVPSLSWGSWTLAIVALAVWLLLIEYASCAGWMQAIARWISGLRKKPSTP